MKTIIRTTKDVENVLTATQVECPYCGKTWREVNKDKDLENYVLTCKKNFNGCGESFIMTFKVEE